MGVCISREQKGYISRLGWDCSHGPLARTIETQADGRPLSAFPQETEAGDRPRAAIRVHRGSAPEALPHKRGEPQGAHPERGVRQRPRSPHVRDEESQDRHGEGEPLEPELRDAEHHHPRGDDPDGNRTRPGHVQARSAWRDQRRPARERAELGRGPHSADRVIPTSLMTAYGTKLGMLTSPHHIICSGSSPKATMFFRRWIRLSVRRMSFHASTTSPFRIWKIPSLGIVERSPVTYD